MAASSFEEKVRGELESLRLKPEEQVWLQVEAALVQEKKRRWLLWFLLFAGLAGGASMFYLAGDHGSGKTNGSKMTAPATINSQPKHAVPAAPALRSAGELRTGHAEETVLLHHNRPNAVVRNNSAPVPSANATIVNRKQDEPKKPEQGKDVPADIPNAVAGQNEQASTKSTIENKESVVNRISSSQTLITDSTAGNKVQQELVSGSSRDSSGSIPEANAVIAIKPSKQSKWSWQLFTDLGSSGNRSGISWPKSFAVFAAANPGNSGLPGSGLQSGSPAQPLYRDALSFSLGAQALRPAGKRSSIGISAGYALYRFQVGVGKRYDTLMSFSGVGRTNSNGFVYQRSDSGFYTNAYHFATLNADYYSLFRVGGLNLRWKLGLGAALLISGNALHYDANTGLLFQNNALIPGLQWNATTGMDIALNRQRFFIGPQLSWFFTKNTTMPGANKHLFNAALRASMLLNKKKK